MDLVKSRMLFDGREGKRLDLMDCTGDNGAIFAFESIKGDNVL
jgi:hypothetical protein